MVQAARSSPLLVGIAFRDRHPSLVVHYKNFTRIGTAFTLMHHQDSQAHRTGNNAARLVKGSLSGLPCLITGERQYE